MVAARARAPVSDDGGGALRKSIKLRVMKRRSTSKYVGMKVATSDKWFVGDEYYAAFQEFGWHVGKRTKEMLRKDWDRESDTRKFIPGKHYMEDVYKELGPAALSKFISIMPKEIAKLVAELKTKEEWTWFFNK
jgi:uncharacterized small protein (DUF1192 family)